MAIKLDHRIEASSRDVLLRTLIEAVKDHEADIPEYHKSNQGIALTDRIRIHELFRDVRNGDPKAVRSIYSALRWMLRIHEIDSDNHQ